MKPFSPVVLAAGLGLLSPFASAQLEPVRVDGGRVALHFLEGKLDDLGLEIAVLDETAEVADPITEAMGGELHGFAVKPESDLLALRTRAGSFQPYGVLTGSLFVDGGFVLTSPSTGGAVDFMGFEIAPREVRNDGPGGEPDPDYIYMKGPDSTEDDFQLCYVKVFFSPDAGYDPTAPSSGHQQPDRLRIKAWDLIVTDSLAAKLGRPDLAGEAIGYGKADLDIVDYDGRWEHPEGQNIYTPYQDGGGDPEAFQGSFKDVALGILNSLNFQGHVGSFGSGRTGMSMATTSCNFGDVNVPWLAAMQEDHPGIAMQLYRELDGRFEQVGVSWIKHGFFALSNSQCITCQNPSPGTFLGVGCSDTYGTGNNADRTWLGPRDEWDVFDGTWSCLGSFFDGTPVDCQRDQGGGGFGPVDHRLEAFDVDLANPGADYYYEAYYIVRGDQAKFNNIGSREANIGINQFGTNFTFSTPSAGSGNPLIEGPAVLRWGDVQTIEGLGVDDGEVVLCATATDNGNGTWTYNYALFNWDLDRKVDSFSVPHAGVASDLYFHDIDDLASNDWVVTTDGKNLTWTFPGVFEAGHKVAGPLEFGTLYNFGFTSALPPATRDATLGVHEAGPGGDLLGVETLGPDMLTMGASKLAPAVGDTINLEVRGGAFGGMVAILSVNGLPLSSPIILTPTPIPFVSGELDIPVSIPANASGATMTFIAADVDTSVVQLSNLSTVAVQ